MSLIRLDVHHLRNLEKVRLEPSTGLNLIQGQNASGKTSLLEAIYLLGLSRSFRSHPAKQYIQKGEEKAVLFGTVREGGREHTLGVQKGLKDISQIRIDGERVQTISALAQQFPLQIITPHSHILIEGPPEERRRFLDWGVFHVEPSYHASWQSYRQTLRQRNALLKQGTTSSELVHWDKQLIVHAEGVHQARRTYIESFAPRFIQLSSEVVEEGSLDIHYYPGWSDRQSLAEHIAAGSSRDMQLGYTVNGPHRADLRITLDGQDAATVLSRGQQKMLVAAMKVAQAEHFMQAMGRECTLLIDDLPAELDREYQGLLLQQVRRCGSQVFLTAIEAEKLELGGWEGGKLFHVEHGQVREVVY